MKRLFVLFFSLVIFLFVCTGCNCAMGIGNYEFNKVHIFTENSHGICVNINSWHDNETGCEVKLSNNKGSIFLSEGTYMLVEDYCPICGE